MAILLILYLIKIFCGKIRKNFVWAEIYSSKQNSSKNFMIYPVSSMNLDSDLEIRIRNKYIQIRNFFSSVFCENQFPIITQEHKYIIQQFVYIVVVYFYAQDSE